MAYDEGLAERVRDLLGARPGVSEFAPYETRPRMPGWIVVDVPEDDAELGRWVDAGADFAASLPAK